MLKLDNITDVRLGRFHVCSDYGIGRAFDSFGEAVAAALRVQRRLDPKLDRYHADKRPRYSRKFIELRVEVVGERCRANTAIKRWEVFPWGVAEVPEGCGGLSTEQSDEFAARHRDRGAELAMLVDAEADEGLRAAVEPRDGEPPAESPMPGDRY